MARAYVRRAVKARARPIFRRVYRRPVPAIRPFAYTVASGPPPEPPPDIPVQVLGGKGPLVRPAYDLMGDLRTGGTGPTIRLIGDINESIERTTRQLV